MIIDTLENASRYFMLHPSLEQAFDFLENIDDEDFPEGKNELVADHLFVNGMIRDTKNYEDSIWESHDKFMDIHFLADGEERIFYADGSEMKIAQPYNAEKDMTVYEGNGVEIFVPDNGFVIFFPGEIHKAMVHTGTIKKIKKAVVKLGME
ncbi:YhcH/YjgK/YiaL family protein [Geofilum sp. OHC36d9]|uniref:YhcH/YjgK/YiaL family protein n=1 Tax=Geofilum sp. OHC36d9 TaxID=3458413 RepID=UPI0040332CDA